MEYIKPIETLQNTITVYQRTILTLVVLFIATVLSIPLLLKSTPYVVIDDTSVMRVQKSQPWVLNLSRVEGFAKYFLESRFEWTPDTFNSKQVLLKSIVSDQVFSKLKNVIHSFQMISQKQKAKSYYVVEGFSFSNKEHKVIAQVTRLLRINDAALATPLSVRFSFQETVISKSNPYGIKITDLEEIEISKSSILNKEDT